MAVSVENSEASVDYFIDRLCPHADKVYQFIIAVHLNKTKSLKILNRVYLDAADHINEVDRKAEPLHFLISKAWQLILKEPEEKVKQGSSGLVKTLSSISRMSRGAIAVNDMFGFSLDQCQAILNQNSDELHKHLAAARKQLLEVMS